MYGNEIGKSDYSDCVPVIGRVEQSGSGNTVIEVGVEHGNGWQKIGQSGTTEVPRGAGHIVLTPAEREGLISELESQRDYRLVKLGDVLGGPVAATVLAVSYREDGVGAVLAYSEHKREYWVWTVDAKGEVGNGFHSFDREVAMNRYAVRTVEHLFTHHNRSAPALTFAHVADRDKMKDGS